MTNTTHRVLTAYRRKRDFNHTTAPTGPASLLASGQRYVMHDRTAAHDPFDLRFEEQRVLPHDRSTHNGTSLSEIARDTAFEPSAIKTTDGAPVSPADIAGARCRAVPAGCAPQLATPTEVAPEGAEWLREGKFDGHRTIVHIARGKGRLLSRNGHDWSGRFATQAAQLGALAAQETVLDGEVIAMGLEGAVRKRADQRRIGGIGRWT